jgi:hypothetical protein
LRFRHKDERAERVPTGAGSDRGGAFQASLPSAPPRKWGRGGSARRAETERGNILHTLIGPEGDDCRDEAARILAFGAIFEGQHSERLRGLYLVLEIRDAVTVRGDSCALRGFTINGSSALPI